MEIHTVKFNKEVTFTNTNGVDFFRNYTPAVRGQQVSKDVDFDLGCQGSINDGWLCAGVTVGQETTIAGGICTIYANAGFGRYIEQSYDGMIGTTKTVEIVITVDTLEAGSTLDIYFGNNVNVVNIASTGVHRVTGVVDGGSCAVYNVGATASSKVEISRLEMRQITPATFDEQASTVTSATVSPADIIEYSVTWVQDPQFNDRITYVYDGTGTMQDEDGNPMLAQDLDITNCLGVGKLEKTIDFTTGDLGGMTFSRASEASYWDSAGLLKFAASGSPRFNHDPITNTPYGILMESERENIITNSDDFDSWVKSSTVVVNSNQATSPEGTVNADEVIDNTGSTEWIARVATIPADSNLYTQSMFISKAGIGSCVISLRFEGGTQLRYDLRLVPSTGAIVSVPAEDTPRAFGVEDMGNYWLLWQVCANNGTNTTCRYRFQPSDGIGGSTGTHYIYGAQVEQGMYPTSYIRTTTAAVTRSADFLQQLNISWFKNVGLGSMLIKGQLSQPVIDSWLTEDTDFLTGCEISDGTTANRIWAPIRPTTPNQQVRFKVDDSGTNTTQTVSNVDWAVNPSTFVSNWTDAGMTMYRDNVLAQTLTTPVIVPTGLDRLTIGSVQAGAFSMNGNIALFKYWSYPLNDTELQNESIG